MFYGVLSYGQRKERICVEKKFYPKKGHPNYLF